MSRGPQPRVLDAIATEIRAMKAETIGDTVAIGGLLREAKDQLAHSQWLPWLQREFGYSARTAQNYMGAHTLAGKYENVADLQLTSTALYRLVDARRRRGRASIYTAEAIAAVLAEAKETRVGAARAEEIAMSLQREPQAVPSEYAPNAEPEPNSPTPQSASLPRDGAPRSKFLAAVAEVEQFANKPSIKFVGVIPADRLEVVANFLKQIAAASKSTA
jgi:Protein of unknown function (DUF3102)